MTSLPSLDIGFKVAGGEEGLIRGNRIKRYVDLSTTGSRAAIKTAEVMKQRGIVQIDCPVSGGVAGAEKGTLAVMASGPKEEVEPIRPALEVFGKVFYCGDRPGMAQSMKLANNFLSATGMAASSEAIAMGVKAGLDPSLMCDVINAGSGMNTATTQKFPALDPARHVRLRVRHGADGEGRAAVPVGGGSTSASRSRWRRRSAACGRRRWRSTAESDFTELAKTVEKRAGVQMRAKKIDPERAMSDDIYEVYAVKYAHHPRKAAENYIGGDPHDVLQPLDYFVWAIRSIRRAPSWSTPASTRRWPTRASAQLLKPSRDGLKAVGVDPEKVEDVIILSHMHYDHCGNHDHVPARPLSRAGQGDGFLHRALHVPRAASQFLRRGLRRLDGAEGVRRPRHVP